MAEVKVYSTATCPWCKRAKQFLEKHNVAFKDLDVGQDRQALEEMMQKSHQMGVPVIDIDGDIRVGYDEGWMRNKLGLQG